MVPVGYLQGSTPQVSAGTTVGTPGPTRLGFFRRIPPTPKTLSWYPRTGAEGYPFDLDASQRFTRIGNPMSYEFIRPQIMMTAGYIDPYMPLTDIRSLLYRLSRMPSGPQYADAVLSRSQVDINGLVRR